MTTAHPPLPTSPAELVWALLPTIAEDLTGELAGGTDDPDVVRKLAAGTAKPSIQGLLRLRVAFEVSALLTEARMSGADIRTWWMHPGVLNAVGEDASPVGVMRYGQLKDAASKILKSARAVSGSSAARYAWEPLTLLLLDVDGVLLPFNEVGSPVRTEELTALDFMEPPLSARRFYYDEAVVAAIKRWAASEDVLINWLTSWNLLAPKLLAPHLGLPAFGTFAQRSASDVYRQRPWKSLSIWTLIFDELPAGHPLRILAIDDRDLYGAGRQLRGMRSEKLLDSLIIEPRSSVGLSPADIARADAFLSRSQAPGEPVDPTAARTAYLPTVEAVATEIREAREAAGLSVDQLASRAGVGPEIVERLEAGGMHGGDLGKVATTLEALGVVAVALPSIASPKLPEDIDLHEHLKRFE